MKKLEQLNKEFGLSKQLSFSEPHDGFIMININNDHANASISLYGGQVTSFCPKGQTEDLLFISNNSIYKYGKAIRGGSPVCWPWFGDDDSGFGRPAHGFSRNLPWQVSKTQILQDGSTRVILTLVDNDLTLAVWPYEFELQLEVIIGSEMSVSLTTFNKSEKKFTISQALHSYFYVGDIAKVHIEGLKGCNYLDKMENYAEKTQRTDVSVSEETDRIYQNTPNKVVLVDQEFNRNITIQSQGSKTTVVWNPWRDTIAKMTDLEDDRYTRFICVETANAADDVIDIEAGQQHTLSAIYSVENTA